MSPDRIEQLLREADQSSGIFCGEPAQLAERILRIAKRRRRIRVVSTIVAPLLAVLIAIPVLNRRPPELAVGDTAELNDIRAEIAIRERTIQRLLAVEQSLKKEHQLAVLMRRPIEDDFSERAAAAVIYRADLALKAGGASEFVIDAYREVIENFPQTFSAKVASERIAKLQNEG